MPQSVMAGWDGDRVDSRQAYAGAAGGARVAGRHLMGMVRGSEVIFDAALSAPPARDAAAHPLGSPERPSHAEVQAFLAAHPADFAVVWLPGYAPGSIPRSSATRVKRALANALPDTNEELRALARRDFRRLQHPPATIQHSLSMRGFMLTMLRDAQ